MFSKIFGFVSLMAQKEEMAIFSRIFGMLRKSPNFMFTEPLIRHTLLFPPMRSSFLKLSLQILNLVPGCQPELTETKSTHLDFTLLSLGNKKKLLSPPTMYELLHQGMQQYTLEPLLIVFLLSPFSFVSVRGVPWPGRFPLGQEGPWHQPSLHFSALSPLKISRKVVT